MTPEQKAASINAQIAMMQAEAEVMKSENIERELQGKSPANGPAQWESFCKRWEDVLGYNSVIAFFKE